MQLRLIGAVALALGVAGCAHLFDSRETMACKDHCDAMLMACDGDSCRLQHSACYRRCGRDPSFSQTAKE